MTNGEPTPGAAPVEVVDSQIQNTIDKGDESSSVPKSDTDEIKKQLLDPRTISKNVDASGRTETARTLSEARADLRTTQQEIAQREQKIEKIAELTASSHQQEWQKSKKLIDRLGNFAVKVKGLVGIGDKQAEELRTEIEAMKKERDDLYTQSYAAEQEAKDLKQHETEIPNPRELVDAYYEKMSSLPLSNEQKRDLLKPEVLASLSTEEYITLWKKLNPYFLTHVTRQGFRDHNAMFSHSAGLKEYHNGFLNVMQDGKMLRPPLALRGLKTRDEASVREWMGDWVLGAETEAQAREKLNNLLHFHLAEAPKYPDETAVHFATQEVADDYYGGESGNEIFFVFPSDFLASQHNFAFNGWEKDLTRSQSETKWNDVFVWPNTVDNPGIMIDAGMVFLPETTPVDPETGSKYASEVRVIDGKEKRVMVEDTPLMESFVDWGQKLDNQSPVRQAVTAYKEEESRQELKTAFFTTCVGELQGLGFHADAASALAKNLIGDMYYRDTLDSERLQAIIKESGAHWKRATDTISAKEYWESYFEKNPHLRPKHIHYYDGDPTSAIFEFQSKNGIGQADTSQTEGKLLGFDDHHVTDMEKDPRSNAGYQELLALSDKIISVQFKSVPA